jgi:hypothetical protein
MPPGRDFGKDALLGVDGKSRQDAAGNLIGSYCSLYFALPIQSVGSKSTDEAMQITLSPVALWWSISVKTYKVHTSIP